MELILKKVFDYKPFREPLRGLFLVDFSWLLHKSYHGYDLSTEIDGVRVDTGDIFGVLRAMQMLVKRRPDLAIVLCLDSRSNFRHEINEDYKAGRPEHEAVYSKMEEIFAVTSAISNIHLAYGDGLEADDLIFTLSRPAALDSKQEYLIYANDRDLYQCLTHPNIKMFAKSKGRSFEFKTKEDVQREYEVSVEHLPIYRAIRGDPSDNLRGYGRFPDSLAVIIANSCMSPEDILSINTEKWSPVHLSWFQKILSNPGLLRSNYEIMRLKLVNPKSWSLGRVEVSKEDVQFILGKYKLSSIAAFLEELEIIGKGFSQERAN